MNILYSRITLRTRLSIKKMPNPPSHNHHTTLTTKTTVDHQDYTPVVFHNKNATSTTKANKNIQSKHHQGNPSTQRVGDLSKVRKLDESTSAAKHTTVSKSFSKALMRARSAKQMTQLDLANATNQPLCVIKHYESGKAIPNGNVINKLSRVLGVSLPSTKSGTKK